MDWINWLAVGLGLGAGGVFLIIWSAIHHGALIAQRCDAQDEFTPSMQRFGYVQSARNRGEL